MVLLSVDGRAAWTGGVSRVDDLGGHCDGAPGPAAWAHVPRRRARAGRRSGTPLARAPSPLPARPVPGRRRLDPPPQLRRDRTVQAEPGADRAPLRRARGATAGAQPPPPRRRLRTAPPRTLVRRPGGGPDRDRRGALRTRAAPGARGRRAVGPGRRQPRRGRVLRRPARRAGHAAGQRPPGDAAPRRARPPDPQPRRVAHGRARAGTPPARPHRRPGAGGAARRADRLRRPSRPRGRLRLTGEPPPRRTAPARGRGRCRGRGAGLLLHHHRLRIAARRHARRDRDRGVPARRRAHRCGAPRRPPIPNRPVTPRAYSWST